MVRPKFKLLVIGRREFIAIFSRRYALAGRKNKLRLYEMAEFSLCFEEGRELVDVFDYVVIDLLFLRSKRQLDEYLIDYQEAEIFFVGRNNPGEMGKALKSPESFL